MSWRNPTIDPPTDQQQTLVTSEQNDIIITRYNADQQNFRNNHGQLTQNVTAWMPLPEPFTRSLEQVSQEKP